MAPNKKKSILRPVKYEKSNDEADEKKNDSTKPTSVCSDFVVKGKNIKNIFCSVYKCQNSSLVSPFALTRKNNRTLQKTRSNRSINLPFFSWSSAVFLQPKTNVRKNNDQTNFAVFFSRERARIDFVIYRSKKRKKMRRH